MAPGTPRTTCRCRVPRSTARLADLRAILQVLTGHVSQRFPVVDRRVAGTPPLASGRIVAQGRLAGAARQVERCPHGRTPTGQLRQQVQHHGGPAIEQQRIAGVRLTTRGSRLDCARENVSAVPAVLPENMPPVFQTNGLPTERSRRPVSRERIRDRRRCSMQPPWDSGSRRFSPAP